MSFTKVAPAGIGTSPGNSILIGDSLLHSTGIDIGSSTGVGVTIRQHGDATFTGIITASAFFGDGSGLEGVSSSGIGTPLSDDDTSQLNKVYYVNQELSIGSTVTVNHPDSAIASYTHYQDLVVKDDADFIVSDGDTFIPDVLGIRTSTSTASAATGGRIRAGTITNAGANGAPNFPNGLTGTAGTFTGNLNVGGVLTYEDVTNIDSVGVITARQGIRIGAGKSIGSDGAAVVYYGDGSNLTGAGPTLSGGSNDRVITATGANALLGEANLTFSGSVLNINGTSDDTPLMLDTTSNNGAHLRFRKDGSNQHFVGAGGGFSLGDKEDLSLRGYDNILFATGNSSTERMRISSQGYVTKPNQPSFHAVRTAGDVSGNNYIVFNRVDHNNGSHYDNSNGRFTAPVTGVYFFSAYHFTGSTSAFSFRINGSQFGAYAWDDTGGCATWVCPMTAGQYAQIYTVSYTWRGTSDYHNGFNGFLIG